MSKAKFKGGLLFSKIGKRYYILAPESPIASKTGYAMRSRLVASEFLGRPILPEEIVHHINEDSTNDALENLRVFPNRGEHSNFHRYRYVDREQILQIESNGPCCLLLPTKEMIMEEYRKNPKLSYRAMEKILGTSKTTICRYINS